MYCCIRSLYIHRQIFGFIFPIFCMLEYHIWLKGKTTKGEDVECKYGCKFFQNILVLKSSEGEIYRGLYVSYQITFHLSDQQLGNRLIFSSLSSSSNLITGHLRVYRMTLQCFSINFQHIFLRS